MQTTDISFKIATSANVKQLAGLVLYKKPERIRTHPSMLVADKHELIEEINVVTNKKYFELSLANVIRGGGARDLEFWSNLGHKETDVLAFYRNVLTQ